jgi:hypothetical protein
MGASSHRVGNTFITSSPKWLISCTANRQDFGFGKAREEPIDGMGLCRNPLHILLFAGFQNDALRVFQYASQLLAHLALKRSIVNVPLRNIKLVQIDL